MRDDPTPSPRLLLAWWGLSRTALLALFLLPAERMALHDLVLNRDLTKRVWCQGLLPGRDFPWEYPPGALPFAAPPFGCHDAALYSELFLLMVLALDVGTLLVLRRLPFGARATTVWLAGFALLGPVAASRYDAAVCLLLAGAFLLLVRRPVVAGCLLALAAAVKVWPLFLAVPTAWWAARRRRVVLGGVATAALLAPVFVASGTWHAFVTTWRYQQDRGLQVESVAALPFAWARVVGVGHIEYAFGSWQVTGRSGSAVAGAMGAAQLVVVAVVLLAVARRRAAGSRDLVLLGTCVTSVLLATGKVLSPQYLLWLVVMVAIAKGSASALPRATVTLTLTATALTHLVYPLLYDGLLHGAVLPVLVLTARDLLLVALAVRLVAAALSPVAEPVHHQGESEPTSSGHGQGTAGVGPGGARSSGV